MQPVDPTRDPPGRTSARDASVPLRVGDADRNRAIEALGEHLTAGRLTVEEYGERAARISVARTAADVEQEFGDLPQPRPEPPGPAEAAPVIPRSPAPPAVGAPRSRAQQLVGAAAAASTFVALALFFTTGLWYWFLLIPAISAIAQSVWGPDWKHGGRR